MYIVLDSVDDGCRGGKIACGTVKTERQNSLSEPRLG